MDILKKYRDIPVQAKASIWYTICSFFQKGISFIVVPIYVRVLTTAEYGSWNLFQTWRDILIILATLNLYAGVYTKAMVDIQDDRDRYTSSMQGLGTVLTVIMIIVWFFIKNWANSFIGLNTPLMLMLFLYFIVYPAFSFWCTRQRVEYRYRPMVILTIIVSIMTPSVSLLLFYNTDLREKALIIGYLLVQCSVGLFFYVYQFIRGRCFYDREYWEFAVRFNIPLIPHYLSLMVLAQSDRLMIEHYCSKSDVGIYGFAYSLASTVSILSGAINGSRVPWTYEQLRKKEYASLKSITDSLVVLMAVIVFLISLLSPEVIGILGTDEYMAAVYVIPIVVLSVYMTFTYDLFASIEFYYGSTRFVMVASTVGALMNLILNAIFIPRFGFIAAAYTTLTCYIILMLMHYLFAMRVLKKQDITEKVYNYDHIMLISLAVLILGLGGMITFIYPVIRYSLFGGICLVCYINRHRIIEMISSIRK